MVCKRPASRNELAIPSDLLLSSFYPELKNKRPAFYGYVNSLQCVSARVNNLL
jgi:hypothetical protein